MFWPVETIDIFCKVLAAALIFMGALQLISYFAARLLHPFSGIIGAVILVVGLWIFLTPQSVVSLIPIVIGVVLAIHGFQDIKLALEAKSNGYGRWWIMFLIAFIGVALGVLCIIDSFGVVALATQIIGAALIYDGATDLWIIFKTLMAARKMKQEQDALDVDYKEVDE
jgi:uncharacterized membrane protein HdeD (DUF308 family)